MIGELSNSHTYVGGGDQPDLHPVNVGLLGVDYELDAASGLYRFKKIYPGENWNRRYSFAADRTRRQRQGRRLSAGNQRTSIACSADSRGTVRQHRERNHRNHGKFEAHRRWRAYGAGQADRRRISAPRIQHGRDQPQEGRRGHARLGRLHLHPRHGRGRTQRLRQTVLPPNPQSRE